MAYRNYENSEEIKAIEACDKILEKNPDDIKTLNKKADHLCRIYDYQKMMTPSGNGMMLELDPQKHRDIYMDNALYKAFDIYDRVLELDPKNESHLYWKSYYLYKLGKYDEKKIVDIQRLNLINQALQSNPNNIKELKGKSVCLYELNSYQECIEICNKILELEPENKLILERKGICLMRLENYKQAIDIFDKVIKLNPEVWLRPDYYKQICLSKIKEHSFLKFIGLYETYENYHKKREEIRQEQIKNQRAYEEKIIKDRQEIQCRQQQAKEQELTRYQQLRKDIEAMPKYQTWRKEVFDRYGRKCEICGKANDLEIHHRISFHSIIKRYNIKDIYSAFECKQLWESENGSVLCKDCHEKMESSKKYASVVSP